MPQVEYGDPERDDLAASEEELRELKNHPGYHEVRRHFEEWLDLYRNQLTKKNISQRDADRLRGNIEICEDFLGEGGQSLLDMLIGLAQDQKDNGRRSGTNTDRRRRS